GPCALRFAPSGSGSLDVRPSESVAPGNANAEPLPSHLWDLAQQRARASDEAMQAERTPLASEAGFATTLSPAYVLLETADRALIYGREAPRADSSWALALLGRPFPCRES